MISVNLLVIDGFFTVFSAEVVDYSPKGAEIVIGAYASCKKAYTSPFTEGNSLSPVEFLQHLGKIPNTCSDRSQTHEKMDSFDKASSGSYDFSELTLRLMRKTENLQIWSCLMQRGVGAGGRATSEIDHPGLPSKNFQFSWVMWLTSYR